MQECLSKSKYLEDHMEDNKQSMEFILGLFDEGKEKEIIKYIFEEITEDEIIERLITSNKKGDEK